LKRKDILKSMQSGIVAHTYNPSYSGDRDKEDQFEVSLDKKVSKTHLNQQARYGDIHLWFQLWAGVGRRITV
jgi:hypothetical protein